MTAKKVPKGFTALVKQQKEQLKKGGHDQAVKH